MDLLTFMAAISIWGIGGEGNHLMQTVYGQFGLLGVVALKTAGATALACITVLRPWALLPAAGSGIIGATVNLIAVAL